MAEIFVSLATCDPASVPLIPSGNHAQLEGGSVAKILMSTLVYGWVERCSDVANCGPTYFPDKYSLVFNSVNVFPS